MIFQPPFPMLTCNQKKPLSIVPYLRTTVFPYDGGLCHRDFCFAITKAVCVNLDHLSLEVG